MAVMFAKRCEGIDSGILATRVKNNFHLYGGYLSTIEDCVRKTEDAYNFRVSPMNKVYFVDAYRKKASDAMSIFRGKDLDESETKGIGTDTTQRQ